jgi:hypothetical protein
MNLSHLSSAKQLKIRNGLATQEDQLAFDLEFRRASIKSWLFVVLWLFVGNFGIHYLYLRFKRKRSSLAGFSGYEDKLTAFHGIYALGFFWAGSILYTLGGAPLHAALCFLLLYATNMILGFALLATGHVTQSNDYIADRIAARIRSGRL